MKKFEYLDALRGLACIMVVISHCTLAFFPVVHNFERNDQTGDFPIQYLLNQSPIGVLWSGTSAVYIFFVLSGIVLAYSFNRKTSPFLPTLFFARYLRLMIPALSSAVIAFGIFSIVDSSLLDQDHLSSWVLSLPVESPNFLNALYNGAIRPFWEQSSSYNWVLWTMGIELWGSFLVYLLCFSQRFVPVTLCYVGALIVIVIVGYFDPRLAFGLTCFVIGVAFYQFDFRIKSVHVAVLVLVLGIYFAGVHNDSVSYPLVNRFLGTHAYLLVNIASAPLIVLGVWSLRGVQDVLNKGVLIELGRRSFSIYLIHLPILYITAVGVGRVLEFSDNFNLIALLASALVVFLSVFLAKAMLKVDGLAMRMSKTVHR